MKYVWKGVDGICPAIGFYVESGYVIEVPEAIAEGLIQAGLIEKLEEAKSSKKQSSKQE